MPPETDPRPVALRERIAAVARHSEDALRAHHDGDRLRFPMPNYLAVARA